MAVHRATNVEEAPAQDRRPARRWWARWLWLLPGTLVGFVLFSSTGADDTYITYWAADQLRRTGRISNYNGKTLEQSSSLLHVGFLAAVSWVSHLRVTTVGPWMAIVAGALCAPAAYRLCARLDERARWMAAALVATLPPLVYWSFSGLETSLATLFVLVALFAIVELVEGSSTSRVAMPVSLLAIALVRPELGPVFVAGLLLAAVAVRLLVSDSWRGADGCDRAVAARRVFIAAAVAVGWVIVIALARKAYFGEWVARPVSMKTGTAHISQGYHYVVNTLTQSRTFIAVVVGVVVFAIRRPTITPGWLVVGAVVATGVVVVVEPGGDWMEGGRLLAPWLAVTLVLVAASLARLSDRSRVAVICVLIAVNAVGLLTYADRYSTGTAAWTHLVWTGKVSRIATPVSPAAASFWERRNETHARDVGFLQEAKPIFRALAQVVAPRQLVYASTQAGMVPYYLQSDARLRGQPFRFIDWDGLVDDTWDRCRKGLPSSPFGKRVPGARVLSGQCGPLPDVFSSLTGLAEIRSQYVLLDLQDGRIEAAAWPKGKGIRAYQWLAVRRDLAPELRLRLRHPSNT